MRSLALLSSLPFVLSLLDCTSNPGPRANAGGTGGSTSSSSSGTCADAGPPPAIQSPCTLPGSVQFTASGAVTVPGGDPSLPSLDFLHLPAGFCAHAYGVVPNARQIKLAPGGELFVASPTTGTTGGRGDLGKAAILVLPDDNHDGVADASLTFLDNLPSTQGLLFHGCSFYYQDHTKIMQLAYTAGDRKPSGAAVQVVDVNVYTDVLHWPKTLDVSDDGHIYVGNGGFQEDICVEPHPFHGGILEIDGSPNGKLVAQGFRNPINVKCARGHNQCFAVELALDYSQSIGGREKVVPIRQGDDWGFPCCATKGTPYTDVTTQNGDTPDCSGVAAEGNAFVIGDTPFGIEFEPGLWKGAFAGNAFVVIHGVVGTWVGARIVAIPMDPTTGLLKASSDLKGSNQGMTDFATGWDDGTNAHGRPAAMAFSPDGRLFVANDNNGVIFWIAQM